MKTRAVILAVVALIALACGGGSDAPAGSTAGIDLLAPGGGASTNQSSGQAGQTGQGSSQAASMPTAAPAADESAAALGIEFFESLPVDPVPEMNGDTLVIKVGDEALAEALRQILAQAGGALPGLELFVFSIAGTDQKMLVFDITDTGASVDSASASGEGALEAVLRAPEIASAKITRLTMNVRTSDEQGPMTLVFTLAVEQALQAGDGVPSDLVAEVQRP